MKNIKKSFLAVLCMAGMFAAGCDNGIPELGTVNNALVESVVLDETLTAGVSIIVGADFDLNGHISALPVDATNTAQQFESSDDAIASVSPQGVITANKVGDCVITVYVGTDGVSAEFNVTVLPEPYIGISSLRFRSEEAEYEKALNPTLDINTMLIVGSVSETENATEPILFESSNTDVATIDANGIITVKKRGETVITAKASESEVAPATMTVKYFDYVEYERFPGDKDGAQREIMSDMDAAVHTDGGWNLCAFATEEAAYNFASGNGGTGQRNPYRYGMLDGRYIVDRGGAKNDLPTATNGTAFCWSRPGGNTNAKENKSIFFVIDMQESQVVQYFRLVHISNHTDDHGVMVTRVSEIYGSNDNSEWAKLSDGINISHNQKYLGVNSKNEAQWEYSRDSEKMFFDNDTPYRYIKFVFKKNDRCYGYYKDDGTSDRTGGTIQVAELYMGTKTYTE